MENILAQLEQIQKSLEFDINGWEISANPDQSTAAALAGTIDWLPMAGDWGAAPGTYWLRKRLSLPLFPESEQPVLDIRMHSDFPECHVKYPWTVGLTMHFEALVYLDGQPWHGLDPNRSAVILPRELSGREVEILIEAYTRSSLPKTMHACFQLFRPYLQALYYDRLNLHKMIASFGFRNTTVDPLQLMNDKNIAGDWNYADLHQALENIAVEFDALMNATPEPDPEQAMQLRDWLQRKYAKLNNPVAAQKISLVGHCHIDSVWLWPLSETVRKLGRTFSAMLRHLEKYPDFTYLQSSPFLYEQCARHYPDIFRQVQAFIGQKRWEPEGGMFVEADCNMPSGESLARQLLYGQLAFHELTGGYSKSLWLPDVFGFTGALPQLLKQAGVEMFYTCKVRQVKGKPNPYCNYYWEGIDGTRILAHFQTSYISWGNPAQMLACAERNFTVNSIPENLLAYGFGDGGGGATDEDIELALRWGELPFFPKVKFDRAATFIERLKSLAAENELPVFSGEQYLAYHLGTFTSVAIVKFWNRDCETRLHNAELAAALAAMNSNYDYPASRLRDKWKDLLYLQFHDILPGSSCRQVYDESLAVYQGIVESTEELSSAAFTALAGNNQAPGGSGTLFNPLSFPCSALVSVPTKTNFAHTQKVSWLDGTDKIFAWAQELPGWSAAVPDFADISGGAVFKFSGKSLETPFWKAEFNEQGEISGLRRIEDGAEFCRGTLNALRTYNDEPPALDPWEIAADIHEKRLQLFGPAKIKLIAAGPLLFILRRTLKSPDSVITQDTVFHRFSDRIDFVTLVDWHEKRKLLKACFELDIDAEYSRAETAFGYHARPQSSTVRRAENITETPMHRWVEFSDAQKGAALLNDCKYGYDTCGNALNITLLKSAGYAEVNTNPGKGPLSTMDEPAAWADQGRHFFTYSFVPHNGNLTDGKVLREAFILNNPPVFIEKSFRVTPPVTIHSQHVILDSLKQSEDGNAWVLRLYEAAGSRGTAKLEFSRPVHWQPCSLLEQGLEPKQETSGMTLEFKPFEVKSLLFQVSIQ